MEGVALKFAPTLSFEVAYERLLLMLLFVEFGTAWSAMHDGKQMNAGQQVH